MGIATRRVATVSLEPTRGTFLAGITATADGIPSIREVKANITPIRVERNTIRLSMTDVPDIYPGVATVEINLLAEIGGIPPNNGGAAQSYQSPVWSDLMRACGFQEVSPTVAELGVSATKNPKIYTGVTGLSGGTAGSPLRHGETINVNYATSGSFTGTLVGDFYPEDDFVCIDEAVGQAAGVGAITLVGATSGRTSVGTVVRDTTIVVGFRLRSDITGMETVSMEVYEDGKRIRVKGCMGNVEIIGVHGDVLQARFTMRGVLNAYADVALPTTPNEVHYLPPTFLGKDIRVSTVAASPKVYGKDGSTIVGAFNRLSVNSGNDVILRENSLDPSGVNYAIITDRSPTGSFNPDEVLNTDFDFVSQFTAGAPMRLKGFFGAAGAGDGNTIDLICPGIVANSMADAERDNVHTWDLGFDVTGGDYDPSASGESPGNDNEFTLIYR